MPNAMRRNLTVCCTALRAVPADDALASVISAVRNVSGWRLISEALYAELSAQRKQSPAFA